LTTWSAWRMGGWHASMRGRDKFQGALQ
jgi:hypothetical protein